MRVREISSKNIDKQKVIDYYSDEMKHNNIPAKKVDTHAPTFANEENGSKAVLYKNYVVVPNTYLSENCTSVTLDAIYAGGYYIWSSAVPWDLNAVLSFRSLFGQTENVTEDEKKRASNNENTNQEENNTVQEVKVENN